MGGGPCCVLVLCAPVCPGWGGGRRAEPCPPCRQAVAGGVHHRCQERPIHRAPAAVRPPRHRAALSPSPAPRSPLPPPSCSRTPSPSTAPACTHCTPRGRASPFPMAGAQVGAVGRGGRFWSFNTCKIKFVSVQSAVGWGSSVLRGKGSLQGSDPAQSPPCCSPMPQGWARVSASNEQHPGSCVCSRAGKRSGVGAGMGLGPIPCSQLGGFHAVQAQQAQAEPGVRAVHRGCLQGDLQARGAAQGRTRDGELQVGKSCPPWGPEPSRLHPSPARGLRGDSPSAGAPCGSSS